MSRGGDIIPNLFLRITHFSLFPFLLRMCSSSGFAFKYPLNNPSKSRLHLIFDSLLQNPWYLAQLAFHCLLNCLLIGVTGLKGKVRSSVSINTIYLSSISVLNILALLHPLH